MPRTDITDILPSMIVLSGADVVLPGSVQSEGTLLIDGERIVQIGALGATGALGALGATGVEFVDLRNHIVLPGFIDVHVHGLDGIDTLDGGDVIAAIAQRLPKFGVTGFCPTTVACAPDALREVLHSVAALRASSKRALPAAASSAQVGARVLPAHLESNFINPDFRGAQPLACLRMPPSQVPSTHHRHDFDGRDILSEIDSAGDNVGI